MDHWDLLVAFDSAKYRKEEEHKYKIGNNAKKVEFRKVLDGQVLEAKEAQALEKQGLQEERELMLAQIEMNKKYEEEEKAKEQKKKDEQNKMNTVMLGSIEYAKKKHVEKNRGNAMQLPSGLQMKSNRKKRTTGSSVSSMTESVKRLVRRWRKQRESARSDEDRSKSMSSISWASVTAS